mmetsp:Transcript_18336/g.25498  ORF Transcript_18336/g.25498 Transcript_18336/m.25498 type:complete len:113 (+) Transcript_18336:2060-2398(+)
METLVNSVIFVINIKMLWFLNLLNKQCLTFCMHRSIIIEGENYTIGNLLHFFITKNFLIEYCTLEMPHPLKETIVFTFSIKNKVKARVLLKKICTEIEKLLVSICLEFVNII